jgi:hypothetical protein
MKINHWPFPEGSLTPAPVSVVTPANVSFGYYVGASCQSGIVEDLLSLALLVYAAASA